MVENGWSVDYVSQSKWMVGWSDGRVSQSGVDGRMVGWSSVAVGMDGRMVEILQTDGRMVKNTRNGWSIFKNEL